MVLCVRVDDGCGIAGAAGPEEDALQVVGKWPPRPRSDVDAIVASMLRRDVSRHRQPNRRAKDGGDRQYFERALLTDRPRGACRNHSVMRCRRRRRHHGYGTTTAVRDGKTISSPGRGTFVIASAAPVEDRALPSVGLGPANRARRADNRFTDGAAKGILDLALGRDRRDGRSAVTELGALAHTRTTGWS